jgi:hypothetical protein
MPRTSRTLARALRRSSRGRGQPKDAGAAAVEFALVLPILILILFGIIDYGLYFANSLDARAGTQEATREAVVANFGSCTPPKKFDITPSDDIAHVMCSVKDRTNALTGTTYVKVILPVDAAHPDGGWIVGQPLVVCQTLVVRGLTGFVPLPGNGFSPGEGVARAEVVMQIEQPSTDPNEKGGAEDLPGSSLDWSWCQP